LKWRKRHNPIRPCDHHFRDAGEEKAVECLKIGATDYLLKQHLERLVPALNRALHEAEARRQRKAMEDHLVQREQALRHNQERTTFALAAAKMGVWEIECATIT